MVTVPPQPANLNLDLGAVPIPLLTAYPVVVPFSYHDVTATQGKDWVASAPPGVLTYQPGEWTKGITIGILADNIVEPVESFEVLLGTPTNALLGNSTGTGWIHDRP